MSYSPQGQDTKTFASTSSLSTIKTLPSFRYRAIVFHRVMGREDDNRDGER